MALKLYKDSPGTASPGLLMMMLFRPKDDKNTNQPFIAFFKMDPSEDTVFNIRTTAKGYRNIAIQKLPMH